MLTRDPLKRLSAVFAGGCLGAATRAGLLGIFDDQVLGLAAVNVAGALLLGALSGYFGSRVPLLRIFLAVGGVSAFTSWSSLAVQAALTPEGFIVMIAEVIAGVGAAGLGHLLVRRWRA